jgi:hypothetical protein
MLAGAGLGLLASQLNNYALAPISEERVGEAAGVTSATGSFGLAFGVGFAGAIMRATLSVAFPEAIQDEILSINADARHLALQVALLVALLASLAGVVNGFRMMRLPDPTTSASEDAMVLG